RQSNPILNVWRLLSHVNESATSVTLVLKSDAVVCGEPSCWYPVTRDVSRVLGNCAYDGMPGMFRALPALVDNCAAVRPTVRLVWPIRSSFRTLFEKVCW